MSERSMSLLDLHVFISAASKLDGDARERERGERNTWLLRFHAVLSSSCLLCKSDASIRHLNPRECPVIIKLDFVLLYDLTSLLSHRRSVWAFCGRENETLPACKALKPPELECLFIVANSGESGVHYPSEGRGSKFGVARDQDAEVWPGGNCPCCCPAVSIFRNSLGQRAVGVGSLRS